MAPTPSRKSKRGPYGVLARRLRDAARRIWIVFAWRRRNRHNLTEPAGVFDVRRVTVGSHSYGRLHVVADGGNSVLKVGSFCSIADSVTFLLQADHATDALLTYPTDVHLLRSRPSQARSRGDIVVGDDCWIGYGATVLSGVTIGPGAVVGARAVVTRDIPPYAIAVGTPARIIGYRFEESVRSRLTKCDLGRLAASFFSENDDLLRLPLGESLLSRVEAECGLAGGER